MTEMNSSDFPTNQEFEDIFVPESFFEDLGFKFQKENREEEIQSKWKQVQHLIAQSAVLKIKWWNFNRSYFSPWRYASKDAVVKQFWDLRFSTSRTLARFIRSEFQKNSTKLRKI